MITLPNTPRPSCSRSRKSSRKDRRDKSASRESRRCDERRHRSRSSRHPTETPLVPSRDVVAPASHEQDGSESLSLSHLTDLSNAFLEGIDRVVNKSNMSSQNKPKLLGL